MSCVPYNDRRYIGWISPEGVFTNLDHYHHESFAQDKVEELKLTNSTKPSGDVLRDNGWLRITWMPCDEELFVWVRNTTNAAKNKLYDLSVDAELRGHHKQSDKLHEWWKTLDKDSTL